MTKTDVANFVEEEIAGRYRKLSDAARGDWDRAIWKAGSIARAGEIIHFLIDHNLKLNVGTFYDRIEEVEKAEKATRPGTAGELPNCWNPWFRCIEPPADHPEWLDREWMMTDGLAGCDHSDHPRVAQFTHGRAAQIQATHGGRWTGIVRPVGQRPVGWPELAGDLAREWYYAHVLDGPGCQAQRFLERLTEKQRRDPVVAAADSMCVRDEPGATETDGSDLRL